METSVRPGGRAEIKELIWSLFAPCKFVYFLVSACARPCFAVL